MWDGGQRLFTACLSVSNYRGEVAFVQMQQSTSLEEVDAGLRAKMDCLDISNGQVRGDRRLAGQPALHCRTPPHSMLPHAWSLQGPKHIYVDHPMLMASATEKLVAPRDREGSTCRQDSSHVTGRYIRVLEETVGKSKEHSLKGARWPNLQRCVSSLAAAHTCPACSACSRSYVACVGNLSISPTTLATVPFVVDMSQAILVTYSPDEVALKKLFREERGLLFGAPIPAVLQTVWAKYLKKRARRQVHFKDMFLRRRGRT